LVFLAQLLLYLAALAGIVAGSIGAIFYVGGALNKARPRELRLRRAGLAFACLCGIVASAALGFVGVPAILYLANR
jgi:hypothetical protein